MCVVLIKNFTEKICVTFVSHLYVLYCDTIQYNIVLYWIVSQFASLDGIKNVATNYPHRGWWCW